MTIHRPISMLGVSWIGRLETIGCCNSGSDVLPFASRDGQELIVNEMRDCDNIALFDESSRGRYLSCTWSYSSRSVLRAQVVKDIEKL